MSALTAIDNPALVAMASFVLEDGRRWGEAAQPWQWADAAAILDECGVPYHYLTRPRGGSKTSDVAAAILAVMLVQAPRGARLYALAADRDQGALLLSAMREFISRTRFLQDALEVTAYRVVARDRDVVLEILAADASGTWGLTPYFLAIDEIAQWAQTPRSFELFDALRTATVKRRARLVVITTAGEPTHFANAVREHARIDPLWRLHEVPGPVPWLPEELLEEQRRALPESTFRRLHLNQWAESEDRLATVEQLRQLVTHESPLAPRRDTSYVIGLDIGLVNDLTAAALCHREPAEDGGARPARVVVDHVQVWSGSRERPVQLMDVRDWLIDTARRYHDVQIVTDPYQAAAMTQELWQTYSIRAHDYFFNQASVGRLASTLVLAIRNRALALPNDEALLDELARVRLKEPSPNTYRLDHDRGEHDGRAIAIALAAEHLLARAASPGPRLRWLV